MTDSTPTDAGKERTASRRRTIKLIIITAFVAALVAMGGLALLVNIFERKQEARNPFYRVVEITDDTDDPAVWGKNFPLQYDHYLRTVDQVRTRFGGSEALPHSPTEADPRSVVSQSKIEEDPRLIAMWAGYAFSKDFREERGHAFMLDDQTFTERQKVAKQPGTCLNCHASMYSTYKRLGNGDLIKGFEAVNQMPYFEARKMVEHPVACIDCHNPATMQLRVTRPAFMEGLQALAASDDAVHQMPSIARWRKEGRKGAYDVNAMASRQEMRAFVCGQCHVEYYFKGAEKARVEIIQNRIYKLRNVAMDALMDLISDLKGAKAAGRSEGELITARQHQRRAQFYLDFVEAENSTGFHAPQEAARILGESIDFSRKGQNALQGRTTTRARPLKPQPK